MDITSARGGRRGFTLIEIMLVCAIIGILSTLAIPAFQRVSARAQKAELNTVLGKVELVFRNNYETTGVYGADIVSDWNPPGDPGPSTAWNPTLNGWKDFPFPPDGGLHLRYQYIISESGKTLTLKAMGNFIGIPGWSYTQTFSNGATPADAVELPLTL
jgi:prepilin-type N-terminal cleavage/methylation domain-containing protein